MWWTFNSFPFGGIFMRVFRPGSNLRKTFVLNPEKTYSINMITAWLCDSDSAENRRVYSWKVNRDTICQRKWTLIKRQPKISLGIFNCFCVCVRKNIYKNCWLKFCRVQAVRRAWTHRDNKRNSGLFFFFLGPVVWLDKCSEALEALKLVWIILLKMTVWHLFFLYYREREFREEKYKFETETKVFRQSELNLLRTLYIQRSRESLSNMSSKIYKVFFYGSTINYKH